MTSTTASDCAASCLKRLTAIRSFAFSSRTFCLCISVRSRIPSVSMLAAVSWRINDRLVPEASNARRPRRVSFWNVFSSSSNARNAAIASEEANTFCWSSTDIVCNKSTDCCKFRFRNLLSFDSEVPRAFNFVPARSGVAEASDTTANAPAISSAFAAIPRRPSIAWAIGIANTSNPAAAFVWADNTRLEDCSAVNPICPPAFATAVPVSTVTTLAATASARILGSYPADCPHDTTARLDPEIYPR